MKFLYFKNADVFGPLEASDIAKESWFSSEVLVCPEDKSDDQSAWKFAKEYPEFNELLNQNKNSADLAQQETKETVAQDLPALEDTATDSSVELAKDDFLERGIGGRDVIPSKNNEFTTELINIPQGYTFHVDHKPDNVVNHSPNKSVASSDASQEDISKGNISNTPPEKTATMRRLDDTVAEQDSFLEISNNKIISSSDGRVKQTKKNDFVFILSFVVITVVAVAICFAFINMGKNKEESYNEVNSGQNSIEENVLPDLPSTPQTEPTVQTKNEVATQEKEITQEDQAVEIVKNTMLKHKGKTIDAYLQELYGTDYKCSWTAKQFTAKTYIVEFFASQVRSEPFVYLFRVDIDEKEITGALNNITLDLLA